jgi:endonuclease/exonuclease/phosphatase (EEP) superfamily protein YafD
MTPVSTRARTVGTRAFEGLAWAGAAGLFVVVVTRTFGIERPAQFVLLQSLTPWLFLPAWPVAAYALWRRRKLLAVASALLALAHVVAVVPALTQGRPSWAGTAPTIRVLEANLFDDNSRPDAAARALMAQDADVVMLMELTPRMHRALDQAGFAGKYPFSADFDLTKSRQTEQIFSKHPFVHSGPVWLIPESSHPMIDIRVGDQAVRLIAPHVSGAEHDVTDWQAELEAISAYARSHRGPLVFAGDFNANRWTPAFGDVVNSGLHDGHEQVGRGLSFSWPAWRHFTPLIRLDHVLMNDEVSARSVQDFAIPGSDHRGFVATLAVKQTN